MYSNMKNLIILSVFLAAAIILVYYREELTSNAIVSYSAKYPPINSNSGSAMKDELELALEKASMPAKKTVIIAIINEAYVEPNNDEYPSMFDLFLEGFWVGNGTRPLLNHLLLVSMDATAHERCRFRRLNCYLLAAEGGEDFTGEKVYMSEEFIEMMWRRTAFLLDVVKRGYSFIFTDADVIWLRDPVARLTTNETFDLQISTDWFLGDPFSVQNPINTGFYMIRSSNKTTSLYEKWYGTRTNATGMKEQDVLQMLIREKGVLRELNISAKFLDTQYFSGFCNKSRNVGSVLTVHANCCRTIRAKVVDLKGVLRDWKGLNVNGNSDFQWSPHTACGSSW